MSGTAVVCGNPGCGKNGTLKCSGCATVSYCSPACQKQHWAAHKAICKTAKSPNSSSNSLKSDAVASSIAATGPTSPVGPAGPAAPKSELEIKFHAIQAETQKMFVAGDFTGSIKSGLSALEIAKQLPPAIATTEIVQIHLNCSSAYMQMQKFAEAVEHSDLAVQEAENGLRIRAGQPQAVEVLAITFGTKAFNLINLNKLDEASEAAERSLALAESIYPKNDPRLHKSLRALGLVRDRQGKTEEAEKHLFRSYTILSLAAGPHSTEAQMSIDELCNMMLKKNDLASAEKYARLNYKSLSDKPLDERGELILGDSASRVAQIIRRQNRLPEAEELMQQALNIREEKLLNKSPLGVAYTLSQLAAIQEAQGKVGADVEAKLMRALDIFGRTKGQASPEVQNTLNQLRNVRSKRNSGGAAPAVTSADEDGLKYAVSSESKGRLGSSSSSSSSSRNLPPGATTVPVRPDAKPTSGLSDDEELAKLKFGAEDGMARMMAANTFFEQGRFSCAEVVLAQAYEILLRQKGPNDQITMAAKQNLGVARSNGLNKLWMQVVGELVLEQEEKLGSSSSLNNLKDEDGSSNKKSVGSKSAGNFSSEEKGQINEYAALMSGKGKKGGAGGLEEMLFNDKPAKQGGCTVC
eukprot:CAMPEP_0170375918 /NCGR_PEP_ID=MMETSP0117_2-20130122/11416_1 /TAXON_ID=400756 /ORGANISM="Durinskia baltica, Strain CSIRO CS-38" /LENGTH=637 /DNA_ID=CAMNT_0010631023 /DNA_START=20 /DNA_END=1933 /DNA_ORIENTATION=-